MCEANLNLGDRVRVLQGECVSEITGLYGVITSMPQGTRLIGIDVDGQPKSANWVILPENLKLIR
jgi:hypothetical protein